MTDRSSQLPYGVGRLGVGFWLFMAAMAGVFGVGVYAYAHELQAGPGSSGMRNLGDDAGAAWGMYIVFYVFFVGVSFPGITLAALIRLMRIRVLEPIARLAELLAVISLLLAGLAVVADLGRPMDGLILLPKFARPMSPFFGTFTLVIAGYFFASFVYLYLTSRRDMAACAKVPSRLRWLHRLWAAGYRDTPGERSRHDHATFWLALLIIPLLITAHSTLGFVFGIQVGRPGWFGTLQAPAFVVLAGVSGVGFSILLVALLRKVMHLEHVISERVFPWLGNFLWVLSAIYIYFMISEWLTVSYAGREIAKDVEHSLTLGPYAVPFYITIGTLAAAFVLPLIGFLTRRWSMWLLIPAGICANVAAVLKRYVLVVSSQTHGSLLGETPGSYAPAWGEYAVIAGLFALGAMLYAAFLKAFPIVPVVGHDDEPIEKAAPDRAHGRRLVLFWATLTAGIVLATAGFQLSPGDVPRAGVPYAPVLFIVGVMLMFLSAIVYELVPAKDAAELPAADPPAADQPQGES